MVIVFVVSKVERNWLLERYVDIVNYINGKGVSVVLCGGLGKLDREIVDVVFGYNVKIV